jgi:uncharacterized membrane protein
MKEIAITEQLKINKLIFSAFVLILFHISAIIGVSIGYQEWFVTKTPINLILSFVLLIWNYPIDNRKLWLLCALFFFTGMLAEWIGVNKGWLFGNYSYGENMGPKFDGVPYLIGIYWAVLTFVTGTISNKISNNFLVKIFSGAFLMTLLDFVMETSAPVFDFWTFEGGEAPFENFLTWFLVALALHWVFQKAKVQGNFLFSLILFLTQLVFFSYFYGFNSL